MIGTNRRVSCSTLFALTGFALLLISTNASAAGGACPSGADYLNTSTNSLVTLSSLGVTGPCYYISAAGADTNNGTSENAPWLHAPGMTGCAANCLTLANANGPSAGQGIIFRGGDTWHYGNGTTSSTGLPWTCGYNGSSCSGTSGSPVYIGIDLTWYAGASWTRPIFNMDNPLSTSTVSSCTYDDGVMTSALNHEPVFFYNVNYLIFDNFEFKGYCWDKTAGSYLYEVGNNLQFNRLYFHGWTYVSEVGANCTGGYCDVNHMITGSGNAGIFAFNTFDGSDSSPMSGFAMYQQNAYDVHGTVCRHLSDCAVLVGTHTFHDNLAELMTYSYDGTSHANTWEFMDNYGGNNLYYNNIIRNTSAYGAPGTWWRLGTQTSTDYVFNNVIYGVNASYPTSDNCFMIAQPVANTTTNAVYFYNNTFDNCVVQTNGNSVTHPFYGTLNFENNQFIGYPAQNLAGVWQNGSGSGAGGATAVDLGGQVYQTEAKANSQGYTPSNNYAPTSGSGPTVGAGSNLTSLCNIASALCTDTTLGDTRTPNARPRSAAWDGGAYLFIDTNPLPPANVTATPH